MSPSVGVTTTRIYLSPDGTINAGELINSITRSLSIKPGASVSVKVPLAQIPATLNGLLDVLAEVTDPNAIRTFINSGTQVTVGAPFISLSATFSAPIPATLAPGKSARISVTIDNSGNIASTGLATINIGLTVDKVTELPGSTTLAKAVTIPAGKSIVLHLKIKAPSTLAAGLYFPYLSFDQAGTSITAIGASAVTVS